MPKPKAPMPDPLASVPADFLEQLHQRHTQAPSLPSSDLAARFAEGLLATLFPEQTGQCLASVACLRAELALAQARLLGLLTPLAPQLSREPEEVCAQFMAALPDIYATLTQDAQATFEADPAAASVYEVMRAYPGFYALGMHRQAHALYRLGVPLLPRLITERAHSKTGIDIHPGAKLGGRCVIDHGTGLVIGETAQLGEGVRLFQGVTIGALSVSKAQRGKKRHPTIEGGVVIYAGATILGGDTVVGAGSVIGGNVWLTHSLPAGSRVYHRPQIEQRSP